MMIPLESQSTMEIEFFYTPMNMFTSGEDMNNATVTVLNIKHDNRTASSGSGKKFIKTNSSEDNSQTPEELFQAAQLAWRVVPPVLLLLGTFGNSMTIVVLRARTSHFSLYLYLMTLAISDLVGLYVWLGHRWLVFQFNLDYTLLHSVVCKANVWAVYVTGDLSAWILVAVTLQRAAAIVWPHRAHASFTVGKTYVVIATLVGVIMLLHSHLLYGWSLVALETSTTHFMECALVIDSEYGQFFTGIWSWVYVCTTSLCPFTLLLVGNVALLKAVVRSIGSGRGALNVTSEEQVQGREKLLSSMSVTLIVTSIVFFVLSFPEAAYTISLKYSMDFNLSEFLWSVTSLLKNANYAVNFYLYCLTGAKFRLRLKDFIWRVTANYRFKPFVHFQHRTFSGRKSQSRTFNTRTSDF